MVREEKASGGEAKARGGDNSAIALSLNVLHSLLPNDVGLNLVLHHRPDSLLPLQRRGGILKHGDGGRIGSDGAAAPDEARCKTQEELAGGDGERFLLGRFGGRRSGGALDVALG